MIGVKSIAAVALAAIAIGFGVSRLDGDELAALSADAGFAIGLFASVAAALVTLGWRPDRPSRVALVPRPPWLEHTTKLYELPSITQRALIAVVFVVIGLSTFDNVATARIASVPASLVEPSRAEYCQPQRAEALRAPEAKPEPIVVDQAGCALVKRAFELGYKKDLGSCAPKVVKIESPRIQREREVCTKRQPDEPFLHYTARRIVETASDASPVDSTSRWIDELGTRARHVEDLLADIRHSVTGTPHASHHVWVNLPDPRPRSTLERLTGHEPCTSHFAELALWPRWTSETSPSSVFEHVFGQLLFATRFGTPVSCSDYTIHWDAPADVCTQLAADPIAFLDDAGALGPMRDVIDRRKRQLALRSIAAELGHPPTLPPPPDARFVVSTACFVVGVGDVRASGRELELDGEKFSMREVRAPAIRATGAGPIDVYTALALLLGGAPHAGPAIPRDRVAIEPPGTLDNTSFPLLRLEPLVDADPFTGQRAALDRAELLDVFPLEQHLFGFVDAFRRAYLPQRGRL